MPQPKKPPAGQGAPTADDDPRSTIAALRELLFLPRERVRETVDDAVRRGRITRNDAEDLVDRLMELGRQQTDDVLTRLEKIMPGGGPVVRAVRNVDRARRGGGIPIDNYDDLTAAQITSKLEGLSAADLRSIREYEKKNANRKSVLAALDKRLA